MWNSPRRRSLGQLRLGSTLSGDIGGISFKPSGSVRGIHQGGDPFLLYRIQGATAHTIPPLASRVSQAPVLLLIRVLFLFLFLILFLFLSRILLYW